jgi:rod shape determining protein RodA
MEAIPRPRPFEETRRPGLLERAGFKRLDLGLTVAALGLIGFSIYTLGVSTANDIPGDPHHYVIRQSIYAVVGVALMLTLARIDYSRFRELRVGIYTVMIATIILVLVLGEATRGSRRWIELPFFTFQPSELGKVLLIVALAAFAIDTVRRISPTRRTARLLLLGPRTISAALPCEIALPPGSPVDLFIHFAYCGVSANINKGVPTRREFTCLTPRPAFFPN